MSTQTERALFKGGRYGAKKREMGLLEKVEVED